MANLTVTSFRNCGTFAAITATFLAVVSRTVACQYVGLVMILRIAATLITLGEFFCCASLARNKEATTSTSLRKMYFLVPLNFLK